MKTLLLELRRSVLVTLVFAVLLCGAYPLAVWAGAALFFPGKAQGSLVKDSHGLVRGSALIGQPFHGSQYFQPRPSAAGAGYDAANSSGTNLGPTSKKLKEAVEAAVKDYRNANGLGEDIPVPADAVTSSASGLDPHISLENARLQAPRVAKERGLALPAVLSLVDKETDERDWNVLGEPGVNVLRVNLALDALKP